LNNLRKYFNQGLNADDDFEFVKPGQWVNASNVRILSTDSGATGRMEAVGGTALLYNNLPSGQNHCIGGCENGNRLFFFNWNENGNHGIYCFDKTAGAGYKVLLNSQVAGGLNFNKYAYIHSPVHIGNKLYWTDNLNEPRCINTEAGIKLNHPFYDTDITAYTSPLPAYCITIIHMPPNLPPIAVKRYDSTFSNNFLSNTSTQYALRYLYNDYEYSVIGPYSELMPYNNLTQTENYINVTVPVSVIIPQNVLSVEIIEKNSNISTVPFIIHRFDQNDIDDHNSGLEISFNFYNNITGTAVDAISAGKPFENIGLTAGAMALAKNRLFLANSKAGYTAPEGSSLTTSVTSYSEGLTSPTGTWSILSIFQFFRPARHFYIFWLGVPYSQSYYFENIVPPSVPTDPIDLSTATIVATAGVNDMFDLIKAYYSMGNVFLHKTTATAYTSITTSATVVDLELKRAFKSGGIYQVATWFFDQYRRKCGVVYREANKILMPDRSYDQSVYNSGIDWALSNNNALTEIPDFAQYYCVGRTKCLSTNFFIEGRCVAATYVLKDNDGVFTYATSAYSNANYGVGIDISTIIGFGMGYVFNEADIVNIYLESDPTDKKEFSLLAQDGKWLILQLRDIGVLDSSVKPLFEIYTPLKESLNELFYEVGSIFPINNPGENNRSYSITSGSLNGDVYLIKRQGAYFTENMNPNDKYWRRWETDIGWPNIIDRIGQKTLPYTITFSDVYLQGTKVNGLSSFSALNEETLGSENGAIRKLQLANKVQTDGSVLLAICEKETISMYLGEQELFDTQGSAYVARANTVIGTIKSLNGSLGTSDPESVCIYNGLVWWFDRRNGCFVQYANNGLFQVSKNKFVRPANLFSKKLASLSPEAIEELGSRPFVIGGYDPYHKEVIFSIPTTESSPPKGYLEDYSDIIYPYDIYDGKGKTLVYKNEADGWMGSMSFESEKFIRVENDLYGFKDGALYIFNQPNTANFFGKQFPAKLMYPNTPGGVHTFLSIGLECNKKPSFIHLRTENPYIQSSDLIKFTSKEGIQYASLLRDRLTPGSGNYLQKQKRGDVLFGKALLVMLQFDFNQQGTFDEFFDGEFDGVYDSPDMGFSTFNNTFGSTFTMGIAAYQNNVLKLELKFSDIGHIISKGHLLNHAAK